MQFRAEGINFHWAPNPSGRGKHFGFQFWKISFSAYSLVVGTNSFGSSLGKFHLPLSFSVSGNFLSFVFLNSHENHEAPYVAENLVILHFNYFLKLSSLLKLNIIFKIKK